MPQVAEAETSIVQQAQQDAANLTQEHLDTYQPGQNQRLAATANQPFVQSWAQTLPPAEQAKVIDPRTNVLTPEGHTRLANAMVAHAYQDPGLLRDTLEAPFKDAPGVRQISQGLVDAAADYANLRNQIDAGETAPALDITPNLAEALRAVHEAGSPAAVAKILTASTDIHPATAQILRGFLNSKLTGWAPSARIARTLSNYANQASSVEDLGQGQGQVEPAAILQAARTNKTASGVTLFGAAPLTSETQAQLSQIDAQIDRLQEHVQTLQSQSRLTPESSLRLQQAQQQLSNRLQARAEFEKRFRPPVRRTGKKTLSPELEEFHKHQIGRGTPAYTSAFADAGHDPRTAVNKPITEQIKILHGQTKKKFGFSDIEIASGRPHKEVRDQLLDLYRAGQDIMNAAGYAHEVLSLRGKLRLVLERADPKGTKFGAFAPLTNTITVRGRANSLGHEWVHALDRDLMTTFAQQPNMVELLSRYTRAGNINSASPVGAWMAKVMNTLYFDQADLALKHQDLTNRAAKTDAQGNPTPDARRARVQLAKLEAGGTKLPIQPTGYRTEAHAFGDPRYFANPQELLARATEAWLARKVENNGGDPRGVVMPDEAYLNETNRILRMLYPKDDERTAIFAALQGLHDAIRMADLYGTVPGAMAQDYGVSDPNGWNRLVDKSQPGLSFARGARTTINNLRNMRSRAKDIKLWDDRRPDPGELRWQKRYWRNFDYFISSKLGHMDLIIKQVPAAVRPYYQKIRDKFGADPGSGRYTGVGIEQRARRRSRLSNARLGLMFKENELLKMTPEQNRMAWHALTTGEDTFEGEPIPENIKRLVGVSSNTIATTKQTQTAAQKRDVSGIRRLLDEEYDRAREAGINIQYAPSGYAPRMYDHAKIGANPNGFKTQATKLHRLMFDKDVGTPGSDPQTMLDWWNNMGREKANTSQALRDNMGQLKANLQRQKDITTELNDPAAMRTPAQDAALRKELQDLQQNAKQLAAGSHDKLGDFNAEIAARNWYTRIVTGSPDDFEVVGPSGNYLNHRVLPPEADALMYDYMVTDLKQLIPHYLDASARRVAYAEAFGPKGEILEQIIRDATDAGAREPDNAAMRALVQGITGRTSGGVAVRGFGAASNFIHAFTSIPLLARTGWSVLPEFSVIAASHGEPWLAWKALTGTVADLIRTSNALERAEIVDFLAVVTSTMHESMLAGRMGADYSDSLWMSNFMHHYHQTTGVNDLTRATRRGGAAANAWFLQKLSRDILSTDQSRWAQNRKDDAQRLLNEITVPPDKHEEFARYVLQWDLFPKLEALMNANNEMATLYGSALFHLEDRASMDPYKGDRPMPAEHPWMRLAFQLRTYNYAFMRNVINYQMHKMGHAYSRAQQRAIAGGAGRARAAAEGALDFSLSATKTFSGYATLMAATAIATIIYAMIFNRDQIEDHHKKGDLADYLFNLSFQRAALAGTFDPIQQIYNGLKYGGSVSQLMNGAGLSQMLQNAENLALGVADLFDPSPTNTRQYNALEALYNLTVVPAAAYASVLVRHGLGGGIGFFGGTSMLQTLTSRAARERFATFVVGPKGTERPTLPRAGAGGDISGADEYTKALQQFMPGGGDKPKPQGGQSSTGVGGMLFGLGDDIAPALANVGKYAWEFIPGWAKLGGLIAGIGSGGYEYWQHTASTRNAPPKSKPPDPNDPFGTMTPFGAAVP